MTQIGLLETDFEGGIGKVYKAKEIDLSQDMDIFAGLVWKHLNNIL